MSGKWKSENGKSESAMGENESASGMANGSESDQGPTFGIQ